MINSKIGDSFRFPAADGIRGLAILIVLVAHCVGMFFPLIGDKIPGSAKIGVWLFFALSSFLLTNVFVKKGFSIKNISSYILGRIIRIIPLFILTLIVYCSFGYFSANYALAIFKLNTPWGHLWTIPVEFKFYALLPFIAYLLIKVQSNFGSIAMIVAAVMIISIQQWFYPYFEVKSSSTDMTGYISAFIPGMCCALLLSSHVFKKNSVSDFICYVILIGIGLSIPQIRKIFFGIPIDNYLLNKHAHFAVAWSFFIFFALSSNGKINKIFCSQALRLLGRWSFSIYLFHWIVYTEIMKHHMESYVWAFLAFSLAIIIGGLVCSVIERPLENGRHFLMRNA
ncbi:acyltransferase family protein [Sodalis ligni]|uniref:Peptidoglycan/LPS O-acetylase OafA/YrhL n=1 Tax=Sodalis ligni TaxID=2697027 RepID=A0A4R1N9Y2_9GAMM|nr:acyltransferase [Sodalis ligni]TCL04072.1 peptidoglycan/LPS O-acetylase OafA/YrhL [Sodalis ligni]